jgi:hypothetical protein
MSLAAQLPSVARFPIAGRRWALAAAAGFGLAGACCSLVIEGIVPCEEWQGLSCPEGYECADGLCVSACELFCEGRECGPDGCGGTCGGGCDAPTQVCDTTGGVCVPAEFCDSAARLCWQMIPDHAESHDDAVEHCNTLELAGSSEWRLPTISELRTLVRGCPATEPGGDCGVTSTCTNFGSCYSEPCVGCPSLGGPGPGGAYWPAELLGPVKGAYPYSDYEVAYRSSSIVDGTYRDVFTLEFAHGAVSQNTYVSRTRCVRVAR